MGIFKDAQGQVTHMSLVGFCRILNPSEILRVSLLPARMMKIQSKMKALEWSQYYSFLFRRSRAANSQVSDGILPISKLVGAFMVCLVTCKNEEDPSKNEGTGVVTTLLPL